MPKPNKVLGWDLTIRWSDSPHQIESIDEIPDHIVSDIHYFINQLENQRNEYEGAI